MNLFYIRNDDDSFLDNPLESVDIKEIRQVYNKHEDYYYLVAYDFHGKSISLECEQIICIKD